MTIRLLLIGIIGVSTAAPAWALPVDPYGATPASSAVCPAETIINFVRCELDLCLDEAPTGVAVDHVVMRGHVKGNGVAGLLAYVQHDRSKKITHINAQKALATDGKFEITVPLSQYGSHTVVIQSLRLIGGPQMISAHVARIQKPHDLSAQAVSISSPDKDRVSVEVDLEKSCTQNCGLIGSDTGATMIEVVNAVSSGGQVTRRSNAGADGKYSICVPLGHGDNVLTVKVCSAAVNPCQILISKTISHSKPAPSVRWINTTPGELRFAIDDWPPKSSAQSTCTGEIELEWNRELVKNPATGEDTLAQKLCPQNGEYIVDKRPVVGVNEMGIRLPDEDGREFRYTFGWGRAVWAKDWIPSALAVHIGGDALMRDLPNMVNAFLTSDNFSKWVMSLVGPAKPVLPPAPESEATLLQRQVRGEIPGCAAGKKSETSMSLTEAPHIGSAYVNEVQLLDNRLVLDMTLENVTIKVQYSSAKGSLPLKIGFKTLRIRPQIGVKPGEKPLILLTSAEDDCQFKDKSYCKHQPAIFQPKDFRGNIDAAGAFVMCSSSEQLLTDDQKKGCNAINNVDAKTGLISLSVLDALNEALYCDGSAALTTQLFRTDRKIDKTFDILGRHYAGSVQSRLNGNDLKISPSGITVAVSNAVAGSGFYYSAVSADAALGASQQQLFGITIREDLINQVLAALTTQGEPGSGLLDMDLDEAAFKLLGFDFATECEKMPTPTLCNLRPVLNKIFGASLPMYKDDRALRFQIRGDRVLAPHFSVRRDSQGKSILDFDIPNLQIQFLALPEKASEEPTPIITVRLTVLLSLTVDSIQTDPNDASKFALFTRLRVPESHVTIMPVEGSNHTLVPDHLLVSKLRTLIAFGLSEYGKPDKGFPPITLPKSFVIPGGTVSDFGLSEIQLGDGRLELNADPFTHGISISATPVLIQNLLKDGNPATHRWLQ